MPFLKTDFRRPAWLLNGHFETIIPAVSRKVDIEYERERVELSDGDFIDIDWCRNGSNKLMFLVHGMEGSSDSVYIKGFAKFFSDRGWDICALNFRSCSGEMNRKLNSYHGGVTADLHEIILHIRTTSSYSLISPVGFSLGGNVLLKYLGEKGKDLFPEIRAACAFSVPVDLEGCALKMATVFNTVYMKRFMSSMTAKMIVKSKMFPGSLDTKDIRRVRTFHQFDNLYTAPIHGFSGADDYYRRCSSMYYLRDITIPVLLVNAANDPFLSPGCYPQEIASSHPFLHFEMTAHGGHVGFTKASGSNRIWSEERAFDFLQNVLF